MSEQKLLNGMYIMPGHCLTEVDIIQPIKLPNKFKPGRIIGYILKKGSLIELTTVASGGYTRKYLSKNSETKCPYSRDDLIQKNTNDEYPEAPKGFETYIPDNSWIISELKKSGT